MPKVPESLAERADAAVKPPHGPLWKGPEADGVTFSMLSRFLVCRERFRAYALEGLRPEDQFNHKIEYGQMWHVCEEAWAARPREDHHWRTELTKYVNRLAVRYPLSQEQVFHWADVCRIQFPLYTAYWSAHPDAKSQKPLLQEHVFDVPLRLPSGRTVRLRGKWDSVDLCTNGYGTGVWLQENKSKGDVDPVQIPRQLKFDLQTMMYMVALTENAAGAEDAGALMGVRYNVVRRPLSGGKGTIKQTKKESRAEYLQRLGGILAESSSEYFYRWTVRVLPADVVRFRAQCLDPILETLCVWYDWVTRKAVSTWDGWSCFHWRHPFGVYNVLDEGGHSDLDAYLDTGSLVGLRRVDDLFPELKT